MAENGKQRGVFWKTLTIVNPDLQQRLAEIAAAAIKGEDFDEALAKFRADVAAGIIETGHVTLANGQTVGLKILLPNVQYAVVKDLSEQPEGSFKL